jgi:type III restriction enzyme
MTHIFQLLGDKVTEWQENGYPSDYPAITEILEYARISETDSLRFLRAAQLKALEVYWYLRLVEKTPKVFGLYERYYPKAGDRMTALGIDRTNEEIRDILDNDGPKALFDRIKTDDDFASRMKFEALRESMTLEYPSYILALAMGAGKTILIGSIIATEFAMAMEYPQPEDGQQFIKNALVFAPGKTILGALKEIADIPFEKILPPRFIKTFNASLKLTFTQDGEKDLPIIRKSSYNLIVTNTEKIRIQKSTGVRRGNGSQKIFGFDEKDAEEREVANLRLQALASLPNLGIFSDEAHHTYGQSLEAELKKVRKTVDYLHENTDVICVVNTTGTPFYQKQPLKDVVTWYGLSQGIRDNVLKDISDNIKSYSATDSNPELFLSNVLADFFENYMDVTLPDGGKAKIAIYFPQEDDLLELRGVIERTLSQYHVPLTTILKNTSKSTAEEIADFDRLNDPTSQHRVILLVNKGTEGWNCPSLFATVLARKLKTSNNFVLQAGTRCLRQVVGNHVKASIYLSDDNRKILDSQLQETFGETLRDLSNAKQNTAKATITLKKLNIPKLVIKKLVRAIVKKAEADQAKQELSFVMPKLDDAAAMVKKTFRAEKSDATKHILQQQGQSEIETEDETIDLRLLATVFAANFHLDNLTVYDSLRRLYGSVDEVPLSHMEALALQLTDKLKVYEVKDQVVEEALALVKPEGFDKQGDDENAVYTAEISYPKSREDVVILQMEQAAKENPNGFGFHYTPYNFDTSPERDFFVRMLPKLNTTPEEVEDFLFTGGITAPNKTDFYIEYKGEDGRWHNYFPDFIIRKKDGKCLIVEIKRADRVNDATDGRTGRKAMALRKWEDLNPDALKYEMIFADETVAYNDLQAVYDNFNKL